MQLAAATLDLCVACVRSQLTDVGGSIVIHTFGAYFGLAVSFVLGKFSPYKSDKEGSVYHSDLFAMIGS